MTTKLTVREEEEFSYLFIEVRGNAPDRIDLLTLEFPEVKGTKGLVISCGKVPYWLAAPVISHYKNLTKWQAIKESEKPIAIVTVSFDPDIAVATEIEVNLNCLICGLGLKSNATYPYCEVHKNRAPARKTYQKKKKNVEGGAG
jgi:hypothetical protein